MNMPAIRIKMRNSIKAIIVQDERLLVTRAADDLGDYYLLPGGGQEPDETMIDTLQRECLEEIRTRVVVHDLRVVRDYIGKNHEFDHDRYSHQVEMMFYCTLPEGAVPAMGRLPNDNQASVEWVPLKELSQYRLYPQTLRAVFADLESNKRIYYGDVN
jgi:8-oxo-dGTP diphosphatase